MSATIVCGRNINEALWVWLKNKQNTKNLVFLPFFPSLSLSLYLFHYADPLCHFSVTISREQVSSWWGNHLKTVTTPINLVLTLTHTENIVNTNVTQNLWILREREREGGEEWRSSSQKYERQRKKDSKYSDRDGHIKSITSCLQVVHTITTHVCKLIMYYPLLCNRVIM